LTATAGKTFAAVVRLFADGTGPSVPVRSMMIRWITILPARHECGQGAPAGAVGGTVSGAVGGWIVDGSIRSARNGLRQSPVSMRAA
jgi:hypothetical protein